MRKICVKILTCLLIALCLISTVSACIPVKATTVAPYSYYVEHFSFKGSCGVSKNVTGMWMDVKVKATASNNNNETITLDMYIVNRKVTKTEVFLSDGQYHTFKNVYLGLSGGSSVHFGFTGANPEITITVDMEIGS